VHVHVHVQDTNETKAAGCAGFGRFLSMCNGMIAIVSKNYFERLWCVDELARTLTLT